MTRREEAPTEISNRYNAWVETQRWIKYEIDHCKERIVAAKKRLIEESVQYQLELEELKIRTGYSGDDY